MIEEGASILEDKNGVQQCGCCGEYKGWYAEGVIECFDCRVMKKRSEKTIKLFKEQGII
jgi:hypothetical protein